MARGRNIGGVNVSLGDVDNVRRVPSRVAYNRPNAIICKFRAQAGKGEYHG